MRGLFFLLLTFALGSAARAGEIRGTVFDPVSNTGVAYATVAVEGTAAGTVTDSAGRFSIKDLPAGVYNLRVSCLGYRPAIAYDVQVSNALPALVRVNMEPAAGELAEAVVRAAPASKTEESPLSLRSLGITEIKRNPGGNRDISRAIQSLPGVSFTPAYRNDIVVRGGGPNENRFFIDGIETPVINHFQTQGASGGPVGMINVDFVSELNFYAGAFPAARGNALSSVLDFRYKTPRDDKAAYSVALGSSDLALTADAPLGGRTGLIAGYRKSYLQFLFKALELPFLPEYDDFQFKFSWRPSEKESLSVLGIGAIDRNTLNLDANETTEQQYLLNVLPSSRQWNYTAGAVYKRFYSNSYSTLVLSTNSLRNEAEKYAGNVEKPENTLLNYASEETEHKLRFEHTARRDNWKITVGAGAEQAAYFNSTYQVQAYGITVDYASDLVFYKYAAFAQASRALDSGRVVLSAGIRFDANSFNGTMSNPLSGTSPRLSATVRLSERWALNFNTGLYRQLPPYTVLGYRDAGGSLVNTNARFTDAFHAVAGAECNLPNELQVTVETFYKLYRHYPFDLRDSVSLANLGGDFGVVGNTPVSFRNRGRSYGLELLLRQRLFRNMYGILSYTLFRSEFQDVNAVYVASTWDLRQLLSVTAGRMLQRNWEIGLRFRYAGGGPVTPIDEAASLVKTNFDATGKGILDYDRLNSERLSAFWQADIRIDKKYPFGKWTLNIYLDIQNIFNAQSEQQAYLSIQRDENGNGITDPWHPDRYLPLVIPNESGTILPTVGIVAEF